MSKIRLVKAMFVESGTYNDMYRRPYQSQQMDRSTQRTFDDIVQGESNVLSAAIAGIAGRIIAPQANPEKRIVLPNSGEKTLRFYLEFMIEHSGDASFSSIEYLTGYSDYCGYHAKANGDAILDKDMKFYFNNAILVNQTEHRGVNGRRRSLSVEQASQILISPDNDDVDGFDHRGSAYITLLPQDVMSTLDDRDLRQRDIEGRDYRTGFSGTQIKKSRRGNQLPSEYLSRSINGILAAERSTDIGSNREERSLHARARTHVREALLTTDRVMNYLCDKLEYAELHYVTSGEIMKVFPEFDDVAEIFTQGNVWQTGVQSRTAHRGDTEHWHSSSKSTHIATMLSNMVPAIMMDLGLSRITFTATNEIDVGRGLTRMEGDCVVTDLRSFANVSDMRRHQDVFRDRMILEVIPTLSDNNAHIIDIAMNCSVTGDSWITVSFDCGPDIEYCVPTFCDALFSPVVASSTDTLDEIAEDIHQLAVSPSLTSI